MRLFKLVLSLLGAFSLFGAGEAFTNPIRNPGGSDPQVTWTGGYYYLISTTWNNLQLRRATTIQGLKSASPKTIYTDTNASRRCNMWAPELHYFDSKWYIYYTAGNCDNLDGQRMHALIGGATPWDSWSYGAQMLNEWGIDGTVVRFAGWGNFFVYSCMTGVPNQSTCVRKLGSNYISTTGSLSIISQPDQSWERAGVPVQEGASAIYFGGKTYIAYSANYCWTPNYCVATLEWNGSGNPAAASSWKKSNGCVLSSANGHYGTGHNSFFTSPDGTETWITFHATSNPAGACDDSRYALVQPIRANANGTPNFGIAQGTGYNWAEPKG